MKTTLRIPTEQYAFIEMTEVEVKDFEEALQKYRELETLVKTKDIGGLPQKEWNAVLDKYLSEFTMSSDEYNALNDMQKYAIQEIKKSIKRVNK